MTMKAYRGALLYFTGPGQAHYESDGLLVVGPGETGAVDAAGAESATACPRVLAVGSYGALAPRFAHVPTTHFAGRILAPGFVDMHIHYPQTDVIGAPAEDLLSWLERYTFPHEARFADPAHMR